MKEGRVGAEPGDGEITAARARGRHDRSPTGRGTGQPADRRDLVPSGRRGRGVELRFAAALLTDGPGHASRSIVPARGEWSTCIEVAPVIDGKAVDPRYRCGQPVDRAAPAERLAQWRRQVPQVETDHQGSNEVIARSAEDLGALRIFDPDFPERVVVAAGAPWFMTVFGRDSLLTAWMALLVDPDLALGVLQTLARFQGKDVDPATRGAAGPDPPRDALRGRGLPLARRAAASTTARPTPRPLFVMLLGEMRRWGLAREMVDELLPNADRAIEWIEQFGDADGDGYVEYHAGHRPGPGQPGMEGQLGRDPLRRRPGGRGPHRPVRGAGLRLRRLPGPGPLRLRGGRHGHLRPLPGQGHPAEGGVQPGLLAGGQGVVRRRARRRQAADRLAHLEHRPLPVDRDRRRGQGPSGGREADVARRCSRGWGVRTLATDSGGYNPISYHCGSVWPHDTAIVAAGPGPLRVRRSRPSSSIFGLLDAAQAQGGRLPELFSGLDRGELTVPVGYPTSCSPQAWAAASPLLCLRTLLRLDPWVPYGKTWLSPNLPEGIGYLKVAGIPLAGSRVTVEVGSEVPGGVVGHRPARGDRADP